MVVIFFLSSHSGRRGNRADMNFALTLIGIGINLAGIALEVSPIHNIWLTLTCVFFGGGFVFLGLFGRRSAVNTQSLLDRLDRGTLNMLATISVICGLFFLAEIGGAIYNIAQREVDIQAAKAGISTPSATPSPEVKDKTP